MDAIYAHARFNDIDLDTRSQLVGKAKNQRCMQAIFRDLDFDFANASIWLGHLLLSMLCSNCQYSLKNNS